MLTPEWRPMQWPRRRVLQLGAGLAPMEGATNHDRHAVGDWIDVAWDLDAMPWPHQAEPWHIIVAHDVIEHMADALGFVNECSRALAPRGLLVMSAPSHAYPAAFHDPTHRRYMTDHSMDYFDPDTDFGQRYGAFYRDSLDRPLSAWTVAVSALNHGAAWMYQMRLVAPC